MSSPYFFSSASQTHLLHTHHKNSATILPSQKGSITFKSTVNMRFLLIAASVLPLLAAAYPTAQEGTSIKERDNVDIWERDDSARLISRNPGRRTR